MTTKPRLTSIPTSETSPPTTVPSQPDAAPRPEGAKVADFDLASLRIDPACLEGVATVVPLTVPVRKPSRQEWIRVHPSPDFRLTVAGVELKEVNEFYVVASNLQSQLLDVEAAVYTLFTYVTRAGVLKLWPIRQPGPDGRQNEWSRSAGKAADLAVGDWVRVTANRALGAYEVMRAAVPIPDPTWPNLTMTKIIEVALKERDFVVDRIDHPLLRLLQGRL